MSGFNHKHWWQLRPGLALLLPWGAIIGGVTISVTLLR
jgi:hypothetical protein